MFLLDTFERHSMTKLLMHIICFDIIRLSQLLSNLIICSISLLHVEGREGPRGSSNGRGNSDSQQTGEGVAMCLGYL